MRKCTIIILGIVLFIGLYTSACFPQGLEKSFEAVSYIINTPRELARWLASEFTYRMKLPDKQQTPQETMDSGSGDCEDFAILSSAILEDMGIRNDIIIIEFEDLKIMHAVCIWKNESGLYSFMSNQELFSTRKPSIEEAISKFYPDWKKIIYTDPHRNFLKIVKK